MLETEWHNYSLITLQPRPGGTIPLMTRRQKLRTKIAPGWKREPTQTLFFIVIDRRPHHPEDRIPRARHVS